MAVVILDLLKEKEEIYAEFDCAFRIEYMMYVIVIEML